MLSILKQITFVKSIFFKVSNVCQVSLVLIWNSFNVPLLTPTVSMMPVHSNHLDKMFQLMQLIAILHKCNPPQIYNNYIIIVENIDPYVIQNISGIIGLDISLQFYILIYLK